MNHLPRPGYRVKLDLVVPYLSTLPIPYGQDEFKDFPGTHGFETGPSGVMTFHELQKTTTDRALDFLQSWLFFGVMARVSGDDFQKAHFHESAHELDSRPLLPLIQSFSSKLREHEPRNHQRSIHIREVCQSAHRQCDGFDQDWPSAGPLWPQVLLSIHVLLEILECIPHVYVASNRYQTASRHGGRSFRSERYETLEPTSLSLYQTSLRAVFDQAVVSKMWCWKQLRRICCTNSYVAVIYLCQLRRTPKRLGWPLMCAVDDTSRCSCFDFTRRALVGAHTIESCRCQPPLVDDGIMTDILRSGGIPLLKCVCQQIGRHRHIVSVPYEPAFPGLQFVALSHIWADGLCHPENNTILACQLHAILDDITSVLNFKRPSLDGLYTLLSREQTSYLWIDFMCIPQEQEDTETPASNDIPSIGGMVDCAENATDKNAALSLMPAIYLWAEFELLSKMVWSLGHGLRRPDGNHVIGPSKSKALRTSCTSATKMDTSVMDANLTRHGTF